MLPGFAHGEEEVCESRNARLYMALLRTPSKLPDQNWLRIVLFSSIMNKEEGGSSFGQATLYDF